MPWPTIASPASSTAVWPGRGAGELLAQLDLERVVAAGGRRRRSAAGSGARVVAQADRVDAGAVAVQDGVADAGRVRVVELLAGADRDRVGGGVGGEHVERLRRGDADPAALADGEVVVAAVAADGAAGAVEHVALALAQAAVAAQEARACPGRRGSRGPGSRACLATARPWRAAISRTSGLVSSVSGKREPAEQRRRQRREHVALVLGLVGGGGEQRPVAVLDDARVVAGDEAVGAEPLGEVDHRRDPHLAVAERCRGWACCRPA